MDEATRTARAIDQPYAEARSEESSGRVEAQAGNLNGARDHFERARGIFERLGAIDAVRMQEILESSHPVEMLPPSVADI